MNRIEIQGKLYDARNEYLKAKSQVEFWTREIAFLTECEEALDRPSLFEQLYGPEPLRGFIYDDN